MIPRQLRIAGFLSYRESVEIDFTSFDLACISGHNGAGKSSLLDAITWALFGQARGRQDAVINLQSEMAEVIFTFELEGNTYRVWRTLPRGKSVMLELQIQDGENPAPRWRPLTERSVRETQARLESILRMDYETFINTSFFLQGKADQFAQQTPARRKEVLASVLGLEVWEEYRERAAARRRVLEGQVAQIEGALGEMEQELSEESARKRALREAEAILQQKIALRQQQENLVNLLRQNYHILEKQKEHLEGMRRNLAQLEEERRSKHASRQGYEEQLKKIQETLQHANEIQVRYRRLQELRAVLEDLDALRLRFAELESERQGCLQEIEKERVRLEAEFHSLREQASRLEQGQTQIPVLEQELHQLEGEIGKLEAQMRRFQDAQAHRQALLDEQSRLNAENQELKRQMDDLKARIDRLAESETCPLCGQPLSPEHRQRTVDELSAQGTSLGQRYRQNRERLLQIVEEMKALNEGNLFAFQAQLQERTARRAAHATRLQALYQAQKEWEQKGQPRLSEIERLLQEGSFALEARQCLSELEQSLRALGYDPAYHQACLEEFRQLREVEEAQRLLETARLEVKNLEQRIAELLSEEQSLQAKIERQRAEIQDTEAQLPPLESLASDLERAEQELLRSKEEENRALAEVGARRQLVEVLESQRRRAKALREEREKLQTQIGHYKSLERAFGKDGVPALLIEQALPQIEERANQILDRLSNGQLSLRFITQAEYKDKKREDRKETLEIQISDPSGVRPYEMYSGGEAFRVNFALRLALAQVLAQRKGARLQTLIIDEGFGSQDSQGRQRLIEAINLVRSEFAKILVITHLDELKDAFPVRIEVEKGARGSTVRLV
ncbi:MAG: AAA family ATPase [Anaerolineales bacterium]